MEKILSLGLTEKEAAMRLKKEGFNEIPSQQKKGFVQMLLNIVREPMLLLLLCSGAIYLALGEKKDALILSSFVIAVIGITFYQERKTENALAALKNLSSPRALVIRGQIEHRIPGREVVREDLIILREGDRIPADATVLFCSNLSADESLLTGESLAVRKSEWDNKEAQKQPGGNDLPFVFSGTLVVSGHGVAKVTSVGPKTEIGKIGKALETIKEEDTLIKKETNKIVKNFAIGGLLLSLVIIIVYGITRGSWIQGFLAGLTLSMAMLPEEFPVVLLIFLTLGAWRISKSSVLTRNTGAIETLGAATTLCVDKTGTLTMNSMKLVGLFANGSYFNEDEKPGGLPENFHDIMEYAILASQKDPFDPIEKEVKRLGELYLLNTEHIHKNWALVKEYNLSKHLLALSHVWESPDKQNYIIAAKGSPEAIIDLCHMGQPQSDGIKNHIENMAKKGLRLLGVAKATFNKSGLPHEQHDFNFEFAGLLGFTDPVRETVKSSIKEAYEAGLRVIMITGDYPGTAIHVAEQIGLNNPEKFITGSELSQMTKGVLQEKIKDVNIFARVIPEQKLLIVEALKKNKEIVAMTGDGVNDAPALKSANIGIAMGGRGTDVAREASDLVLLNDDFSSIVKAVRLGRRIYDNLKKAIAYIFAVHVPIAGMSILPVVFNLPLVLLPAHIAFLELIIDPACSTVFEADPEEEGIMNKPPRDLNEPLFGRSTFLLSLLQGLSVLVVIFIIFLFSLYSGKGEAEARTLAFSTLVFANLMLIITNLSWKKTAIKIFCSGNRALWIMLTSVFIALFLVLYLPPLQDVFHFSLLHANDILITFAGGIISLLWFEGLKMLGSRQK